MPTNLREIFHPQKNQWNLCEPQKPHVHKSGIRVKKKAPRVGWVPLPSEPFLEKNYCYFL